MRLKKIRLHIIYIIIIILSIQSSYAKTRNSLKTIKQSKHINRIINREKNKKIKKQLIAIVTNIDKTYSNLKNDVFNKKKIVIFFDPAHGKLKNGQWQGAMTNRWSCTNKPEEFYSIKISRYLYNYLSANEHIQIKTTDDFLKVLQGKSDTYKNIPFSETIKRARACNAFIIISEHLNNVSILYKASGTINLPGIHITRTRYGTKVLQYVKGSYSGFLTLYNELDASGFSKRYAVLLKKHLVQQGLRPNKWQFGAVGDDRFSYFVDFPISVIYESGFISNKEEEKKLRDPSYQQILAFGQYNTLLTTIKEMFGIDISQPEATFKKVPIYHRIELLKLSRLAVYYLKHGKTKKALYIIGRMEKLYGKGKYGSNIAYYTNIRKKLKNAEHYYYLGKKYAKKKRWKRSRRYYRKAYRTIENVPIFNAYLYKYAKKARIKRRGNYSRVRFTLADARPSFARPKRAPLGRKIILPIEEGETLQHALINALDPDKKTLKKLTHSLKNAKKVKWVLRRKYSKKKKRRIRYWKKIAKKVRLKTGIYLIKLNKKLSVTNIKRVNSVSLDPKKYQNQQYLKNSYFAPGKKHKSI